MEEFPIEFSGDQERKPGQDWAWWVAAPWPPSKDSKLSGPYDNWDLAQEFADKLEVEYLVGELPTRDKGIAVYILTHGKEFLEEWEDDGPYGLSGRIRRRK